MYWLHTIRLLTLYEETIPEWVRRLFFSLSSTFLYSRRLKEWDFWWFMTEMEETGHKMIKRTQKCFLVSFWSFYCSLRGDFVRILTTTQTRSHKLHLTGLVCNLRVVKRSKVHITNRLAWDIILQFYVDWLGDPYWCWLKKSLNNKGIYLVSGWWLNINVGLKVFAMSTDMPYLTKTP